MSITAARPNQTTDSDRGTMRSALPRWPFVAMFLGFPAWWALGFGEMVWIVLAAAMVLLLVRRGGVSIPRGFSVWLLFLIWMAFSVIGIDTSGRLIGFVYRALFYLTVTVVCIYVYNARSTMPVKYVLGVLVVFWVFVVIGGYAGVLFPEFSFRTPLSYVLPAGLKENDVVGEMTVRGLTQYNPDSWLDIDPRPSAPFLYTNGWGNVYSMLMPLVVCYIGMVRGSRLFVPLVMLMPVSLVPAFLTLNRGMFIGLAVALLYSVLMLAVRGNVKALVGIFAIAAVFAVGAVSLDVGGRIEDRMEASTSTRDRANLYDETIARTLESPVFGYGAPRPSETEGAPSAGTQGQVWMVLFSHGLPGLFFFMAWLVWSFLATIRGRDPARLALNSILLVTLVESLYYGIVPDGLILSMTATGLLMRPPNGESENCSCMS